MEALMTFSVGFLPLTIFIASYFNKKSEWKVTKFDLVCGALSILGVILWMITKIGNVAILMSIIADGLAALPTLVKAYKFPESEIAWPWLMTSIGVVFTLLTIDKWTFANSSFIIYIFIVNTLIYSLVQFRIGKR